ncbi:uncharacterized protein METZ01_LOCUS227495 [marine metagenome]|uniref:Uncharacterized protein n=1 Tax=marine metagenome TaxID=408172 RepID=A0A382GKE7_9ZZZZ
MGNVRTETEALALKLAKIPLGPMLAERSSILFKSNQPEEGAIRFDMKIHTAPLGGVLGYLRAHCRWRGPS